MKRPKFSIRWLLVLVLLIGLGLGLGLPAREVNRHSRIHNHAYVTTLEGNPWYQWDIGINPPFWPRYVHLIFGRSEFEGGDCGAGGGRLAETCELVHPDLVGPIICRGPAMNPTPEMVAAYQSLAVPLKQQAPVASQSELANR